MSKPTCQKCGTHLRQLRPGLYLCPECGIRFCPVCARPMKKTGWGRFVCPAGHGEWLEHEGDDQPKPGRQEADPKDDGDPYRREKTLASQLRESGSGSKSSGRKRKRVVKRRPDFYKEV